MSETAEKFWKTRTEYPPVIHNYRRHYLDLGIVLDYIDGVDSILDLGCGEGQMLLMLRELTDIQIYYGYDLSQIFISNLINRWGDHPGLEARTLNFSKNTSPSVDMCICMGAMLYVSDDDFRYILSNIKSRLFICRVPCALNNRVTIDKFSEEFNDNYAAVYRTIPEYMSILSEFFSIKTIDRCYPDEIESEYGSKQFFFVCTNKKG